METLTPLQFISPDEKPYILEENMELRKIVDSLDRLGLLSGVHEKLLSTQIQTGSVLTLPSFPKAAWPRVFREIELGLRHSHQWRGDVHGGEGNTLITQPESENPFGSHYDRVYLQIFKDFLESDKADKDVIEISSGSAGVSCAVMAQLFGKKVHMVIPETAYQIRQTLVQRLGAAVYSSPREEGLEGANAVLRKLLRKNSDVGKPAWFLNHSDLNSAAEAVGTMVERPFFPKVDYFFSAMGNGTSLRGIGEVLKNRFDTTVVGVRYRRPDDSQEMLMPGGDKVTLPFRHLQEFPPDMIETVELDQVYQRSRYKGLTSAMVELAVEQFVAREQIRNKVFLVIDYDHHNRYAG